MLTKTHALALAALITALWLLGLVFHSYLPAQVPTHWGVSGEADQLGPRWQLTLLLPATFSTTLVLAALLPLLGPFRENIRSFKATFGRILIAIGAACTGLQLVFLLSAAGVVENISNATAIIIGVMIAVIGNWLGKLRRNLYIGIRTPWTIVNDEVWERTHRLGAWLFTGYGVLVLLVGIFASPLATFIVLISGVTVVLIWAIGYSLWLYHRVGPSESETRNEPQA